MTAVSDHSSSSPAGLVGLYRRIIKLPEHIPFSLVQLAARVAVAHVFWQSAQSKLASWPVTLQLFANEYNLPFIDPSIAAPLATTACHLIVSTRPPLLERGGSKSGAEAQRSRAAIAPWPQRPPGRAGFRP